MLKLRNPWGHGEWKGLWSDESIVWDQYPSLKADLGLQVANDGIFFMQWEDFEEHFGPNGYVMVCGDDLW